MDNKRINTKIKMKILRLNEIFRKKGKVIIGMVHLKPLPGSPLWEDNLEKVIELAIRDAKALQDGGVDGIIIENFWDRPYRPRVTEPETIVAFTVVAKEVMKNVSIPVGLNVLRNSAVEAAAIAYVLGAKYIRVNAYVEPIVSDSGIIQPAAPELLRYMKKLDMELGILADIFVKHATSMRRESIDELVLDAFDRGLASAVIITGRKTGMPPAMEDLRSAYELGAGPILLGSGLNVKNIELLEYVDGAIVGTYFKKNGKIDQPVDRERVRALIKRIREAYG